MRYKIEMICPDIAVANEVMLRAHDMDCVVHSMGPVDQKDLAALRPRPKLPGPATRAQPGTKLTLVEKKPNPFRPGTARAKAYDHALKKLGTVVVERQDLTTTLREKFKENQIGSIYTGFENLGVLNWVDK